MEEISQDKPLERRTKKRSAFVVDKVPKTGQRLWLVLGGLLGFPASRQHTLGMLFILHALIQSHQQENLPHFCTCVP